MKRIAIVLGGGIGKRLFPLTRDRSKPAVPIGGKYRLVDIPISNSLHSGIKNIFVLTQFNSSSLNNHILNTYKFDYFSRASVNLLAAEQTLARERWFQGTADAVRCHFSHYHLEPDDEVLILSGDHLYRMDFQHLFQFHRRRGADVTVAATDVTAAQTAEFGVLKTAPAGRIAAFVEKPKTRAARAGLAFRRGRYLISMGIYIFRASVLMNLLKGDDPDFGKGIIPLAIRTRKTYAYVFKGYWRDIGTIHSFFQANLDLTGPRPKFSFYLPAAERIFTHPRFLPPSKIESARIQNSLVSEGSRIDHSQIRDSVIGLRSIIHRHTMIRRCVMMGADYYEFGKQKKKAIPIGIGEGSRIENAIIDKNARIGRHVVIENKTGVKTFDSDHYYIRDGIVIVPRHAVIPDRATI